MAKLHYEKIPEDGTRNPEYMKYVPLVNEFAESGKESARVEDTDTPSLRPNTLAARLRTAIAHSEHGGAIKVRQRKNNVYLVLVQDMR